VLNVISVGCGPALKWWEWKPTTRLYVGDNSCMFCQSCQSVRALHVG